MSFTLFGKILKRNVIEISMHEGHCENKRYAYFLNYN